MADIVASYGDLTFLTLLTVALYRERQNITVERGVSRKRKRE